jgi:4-carboxymuconolactone decarboxylase
MRRGQSARIPLITSREDLPEDQRPFADEIAQFYDGNLVGPYSALLHSPDLARRVARTAEYVRFKTSLPREVYKLATLTATREVDADYAWTVHQETAINEGVRPEALEAIRDRKAPEGLTPDEALVVTYVQELLRKHRVSDATFNAARDRFSLQQLVDLTATVGHYGTLAAVLNAFEVKP